MVLVNTANGQTSSENEGGCVARRAEVENIRAIVASDFALATDCLTVTVINYLKVKNRRSELKRLLGAREDYH